MSWYSKYVKITSDEKYADLLRECYEFAWKNSNHNTTKNAALLVNNKLKILVKGTNVYPLGAKDIPNAYESPKKHLISNHSERAAIYEAAKKGIKTKNLIMIMPWLPCFPCTNAIIYSGISTLITHKQMVDKTEENWEQELTEALHLLKKNKIKILMYDGKIGKVKALFRRKEWEP